MIGYDFKFFWEAARAVLNGVSPYTVSGFFSPLPFAWLLAPIGFFKFEIAYVIWTILNIVSLFVISKKNIHRLLLFLPVFFALWVGQVDLIILAMGLFGGWIGLALATLKPQLAFWLIGIKFIEWWRLGEKKKLILTLLGIFVLYGIPSIIQPGWWKEWLISTPSILTYSEHASSLFGIATFSDLPVVAIFVGVCLLAVISFILFRPYGNQYWNWVAIFNPVANIYSLCVLYANVDWWAVILSWVLLPISLSVHTGLPWIVIPIFLWWRGNKLQTKSV